MRKIIPILGVYGVKQASLNKTRRALSIVIRQNPAKLDWHKINPLCQQIVQSISSLNKQLVILT